MGALEGDGPGKGASMDLLEPGYAMEEFGSYSVTDEVLSWPPHHSGFCRGIYPEPQGPSFLLMSIWSPSSAIFFFQMGST